MPRMRNSVTSQVGGTPDASPRPLKHLTCISRGALSDLFQHKYPLFLKRTRGDGNLLPRTEMSEIEIKTPKPFPPRSPS